MKLANWNVAKPVAPGRRELMLKHIEQVRAEVLVLTETHDGFNPGYKHHCSSTAGLDAEGDEENSEHRWVAIWSNHELNQIPTKDQKRSVAARVVPSTGDPFIVFGTVLPRTGSSWREYPSAGGIAYREALAVQLADWEGLRRDFPSEELFVMGDFNQTLTDLEYYGTKTNRIQLESALNRAGLVALTAEENDPIARDSNPCACIDHICMQADSRWRLVHTERWPDECKPPKSLSDHFGVAVLLELKSPG